MNVLMAIVAGGALGYALERGDFCFHSTWRGLWRRPRQLDLMRAYLLAMLVAIPLVQGMWALGWISPWVPPFAWTANLLGGVLFGVGMTVAASCITGLFYKLGHGMLGALMGLGFWALGDVFTYLGPLAGWRDGLNARPITAAGASATIPNLLGPAGVLVLTLLGLAAAVHLWRAPRGERGPLWTWLPLGVATGLIVSLAWLLARVGGADYPFGTSRVPTGAVEALLGRGGGGSLWIPLALVSLLPGAALAAWRAGTLWIRGESRLRDAQLAAGGFLMGLGAAVAGGCNLGHSLVGVPLLSLGSLVTTLAMGVGVFVAHGSGQLWRRRTGLLSNPALDAST